MSTTSTLDSKLTSLNKLLATTPVQSLIDSARYVENLEGGNETRYNPVSFGGRDWIVGPSGDSLVALSTDQSGLGPKEKRYDVLDANGNLTQGVSKDRSMGERFLRDLPKIAAGTAFVLGAPALLNAASGLFSGAGAAAGATGAGALGAEAALTGTTGLLGAESALAVAGVEGAASQLATTAYANAIAAGATPAIASIAADTAAGLVGSGLTDAAILSSAAETAAATAATGAAGAAGNIVGGGGAITAGTTGALTGANALAGTVAGSTAASTAAGAGAGSTVGSRLANAATTAATTLLGGDTNNLLGGLLSSGVNLSMVQDAADKLRAYQQRLAPLIS